MLKDLLKSNKVSKMIKKNMILFACMMMIIGLVQFSSGYTTGFSEIPLITSANQYYSVVFDEEGEAIVSLRLTLRNYDSEAINDVNIEIPGTSLTMLGVLQETYGYDEQVCSSWSTGCSEYGEGETCTKYDYDGNCLNYEKPCLKYGQVCQSYRTNSYNQRIFKRIDVEPVRLSNSYTLPLKLLTPVSENGYTNLLIVYKVEGYADKSLGAHKFNFETAKVPYTSSTVRVAINVQSGLNLKGTEAEINYLPNTQVFSAISDRAELSSGLSKSVESYSNSITYTRGLVEDATYLDPHESFSVKGLYAKSWARVNIGKILLVIMVLVGVIGFLYYGGKKLSGYARENLPEKVVKKKHTHHFMVPFLSGLFTSITIALLWVVTFIMIELADEMLRGSAEDLIALLFVLLAIMITLAMLIGVPIYVGTRFGGMMALFSTIAIFAWMFVFAIILFIIFTLFSSRAVFY